MTEIGNINTKRHSYAHLLAAAVLELYPQAKLGMGPAIENGFYYDFDIDKSISIDDLPKIEAQMKKLISNNIDFEQENVSLSSARELFKDQLYKLEIIDDIEKDGKNEVSIYKSGEFTDLCNGPHISLTNELDIDAFKLERVAGVYWKNNESNKQLQRIYGVAFDSKMELDEYLKNLEEAKKRDHRKIGKELDLFTFHEEAPGMVFWHPKGTILYQTLVGRWREIQSRYGYGELMLPSMLSVNLWKRSGHYNHYKDGMFFTSNEGNELALRPMDCPGGILVYKEDVRSYNDLPIKWSELGKVYRNEQSGEIHGLMRVQEFTQDDAHIFITEDQIEDQVKEVIKIMDEIYKPFDMERKIFLSTKPDDAMGDPDVWAKAEDALRQALDSSGIKYGIKEKDGAFYGPKIDIHVKDALGRSWQTGTIQLDFFMPEKFELEYIAPDGGKKRPVIIHRALMGSLERFVGILTEHYAGAFPVWLAPVQARVISVSDKACDYVDEVVAELSSAGVRVDADKSNETLGKKIRQGQMQKIPYLLVVGDKEIEAKNVAVRSRDDGDMGAKSVDEFARVVIGDK